MSEESGIDHAADEVTALDGLPVTTPARTLLDLAAAGLRGRPLATARDRAEQSAGLDFADLAVLLERYAGRPGTPALRDALAPVRGRRRSLGVGGAHRRALRRARVPAAPGE